jgi:hypothetical protein
LSNELLQTSSIDLITSGCKEGRIGEIPGIVCVEGKYGNQDGSAPVCVGVLMHHGSKIYLTMMRTSSCMINVYLRLMC